ncbi:TPA: hypothetical protein ACHSTH_005064 [Pseudomonas aeruginosa]|uniref:hypothetical protein n=1 Tax=Pseudomonas aeruginosa TaxID=287 RepID=UPI000F522163|nr:hypothetical protein [Pseudomonas aeruginosa]MCT5505960.1 hypothetical protein [Pseudomonas aeruginosa]HCF3410325.1 hypothetical protein [Pseudomonas aeruginosa]HCF7714905.1 hypothetical protein [Pseudomonas aeruginosa]
MLQLKPPKMVNKYQFSIGDIVFKFLGSIVSPFKSNIPLTFLSLGTVLLIVASMYADWIDSLWFTWNGTSKIIKDLSTAIIGAGVFAAVLKSSQFSDIFQKNIHDVFYRPHLAVDHEENVKKWKTLTQSMFMKCLPGMTAQATDKIVETFFDNELDYHFENMEVIFKIEMVSKVNAKITIRTKMNVVVSPGQKPDIFQKVSDSNYRLLSLFLNQEAVDVAAATAPVKGRPDLRQMNISYDVYSKVPGFKETNSVLLERVTEYTQDIEREPFYISGFGRYISGLTIGIESIGCNIYFSGTGSKVLDEIKPTVDGVGIKRWVMAKNGDLLLPGQGYIIVITN